MDVTKTVRDINELDAETKRLCVLFVKICRAMGLPVLITETYRSQARQDYLFEQGRSRPGKMVTWTRRSFHTTRRAFDFCRNVRGREYDDSDNFFRKCAEVAKFLGLNAGYFWKDHQDKPHCQLDIGKSGISDEKANAFLAGLADGSSDLSSGDKNVEYDKLKRALMEDPILRFSPSSAEFVLAFPKYGLELARKAINGEEISAAARKYLLSHPYGAEMMRRMNEKRAQKA